LNPALKSRFLEAGVTGSHHLASAPGQIKEGNIARCDEFCPSAEQTPDIPSRCEIQRTWFMFSMKMGSII
jgi:hypothetical protein